MGQSYKEPKNGAFPFMIDELLFYSYPGSELVDWVMSNLSIEDRGERLFSLLKKTEL